MTAYRCSSSTWLTRITISSIKSLRNTKLKDVHVNGILLTLGPLGPLDPANPLGPGGPLGPLSPGSPTLPGSPFSPYKTPGIFHYAIEIRYVNCSHSVRPFLYLLWFLEVLVVPGGYTIIIACYKCNLFYLQLVLELREIQYFLCYPFAPLHQMFQEYLLDQVHLEVPVITTVSN